ARLGGDGLSGGGDGIRARQRRRDHKPRSRRPRRAGGGRARLLARTVDRRRAGRLPRRLLPDPARRRRASVRRLRDRQASAPSRRRRLRHSPATRRRAMRAVKTWIVLADGARARVLLTGGPNRGLREGMAAQSGTARLAGRALVADDRGRVFDSAGQGRHAVEPKTDPKSVEEERFLRDVVRLLERGAQDGGY